MHHVRTSGSSQLLLGVDSGNGMIGRTFWFQFGQLLVDEFQMWPREVDIR